ncbi:cullin-associated NEDD8-dissociated protein 1-like [Portunus trituberculatus]|uniref:cullin-associated NEDD8-dissociated protein 1-like n=1 Tax=Portunus trituberculatus TaxID=210409 RepID=UPI001E1CE150|nr:cullin-associated NEDD8-dissociated protein 1-like [Portunus trituberculatus]
MASVSYHIANLLEKMTSTDKDYRFMATNDLMTELQKDSIKLDDDSERKVVKMLLRLLEDKNGEVQNLAVKCLGPLVNKVKEFHVYSIVESLCDHMVSEREQLRDMSSLALKTVINELPASSTALVANICKRVTDRLSEAIVRQEDVSVQLEALDILGDLLARFGSLLVSFHPNILDALLPQLASPRLAVRKRTIIALSHLVVSCSPQIYARLMDFLIEELAKNSSMSTTRTYIQCIAAISRQAGHRFGEYLERVMPLIVQYVAVDDDELREYCISACEAFTLRCPKEITPHLSTIVEMCLKYITHDPNYNYDDYDDDEGQMDMDEDDDGEEDDEYSDDDDMSWKVRRSSAKCLEAVISTRHEMLIEFYKTVSPQLINRFKEREENVKVDIFHAYMALLRQTRPSLSLSLDPDAMEQEEGTISMLKQQVPALVKSVHRQMKEKSIKTRQGCFALLTELVQVYPGALTHHIPALIPGIQFSLGDKNSSSNMKIDTLAFVHCLLVHHSGEVFHQHIGELLPPVVTCVADPFYKITAEALLVLQQIVKVIRPLDLASSFDFTPYTGDLYHCTLARLRAADLDQEVKERAIACMGQIISHLGDHLQGELGTCLPIFLDRLRNEITRLTTVKALTKVAASPLRIDLRPILGEALPVLASFLRKNQRALKLATLTLLDTVVTNYSTALSPQMLDKVLVELPPLINESDLHIAQLCLTLLTSTAKLHKASLGNFLQLIMPDVMALVRSPLLQGGALKAMQDLFEAVVRAGLPGLGYQDILTHLLAPLVSPQASNIHKQAYHSMAKCVAALTLTHPSEAVGVVNRFLMDVTNPRSPTVQSFSLLAIGEIGKHIDLSGIPQLKDAVVASFSSSSEEVKSAASYALGHLSCGNLQEYLPFVLSEIEANPKRQYLLLHSLKEIISLQSKSAEGVKVLQGFVSDIWAQLFRHTECVEEGTRNVVAECLGKLTLINPSALLPKLQESLKTDSPMMRTTIVTAIKFTISDQPTAIDSLLRHSIGDFLSTLQDPDLNVRRVALVAFNSAAHNKPSLVRDLLDTILPQLYNETKVRKELIREVEMGPFKHTVDDGLDIRKAAFECMYTLLETCLDRVDIYVFLEHVEGGLRDHYDIKMLTYLMLTRLAHLCPQAVLQRLERLVEPLRTTVTTKVKANSVKQEYEKQDELKRSAMRAVAALLTIPDADKNPQLSEFVAHIKSTPELQSLFESIQRDACPTHDAMMDLS